MSVRTTTFFAPWAVPPTTNQAQAHASVSQTTGRPMPTLWTQIAIRASAGPPTRRGERAADERPGGESERARRLHERVRAADVRAAGAGHERELGRLRQRCAGTEERRQRDRGRDARRERERDGDHRLRCRGEE